MHKLRLDIEALAVETFDVTEARAGGGTVAGHAGTDATVCWGLCGGGDTNYAFCTYGRDSCGGSCGTLCASCASCDGTCYESPCVNSGANTCDGSTCAATCGASCNATCNCTVADSCNCP
jgi:hypothetical protein